MEFAPANLRLLLMALVLGNGIVLVTGSRPPASNWTLSIPTTSVRPILHASAPDNDKPWPKARIFSLIKSNRPAVESGNPR
jgi:hypothetical protein